MPKRFDAVPPPGFLGAYTDIKMAHVRYLLDAKPAMNIIDVLRQVGAIKWQAGPGKDRNAWDRAYRRVLTYMNRYHEQKKQAKERAAAEKKAARRIKINVPDPGNLSREIGTVVTLHSDATRKLIEAELPRKLVDDYNKSPEEVSEGKPRPTGKHWKGQSPQYDDKGRLTHFHGYKNPTFINWTKTFIDDPKRFDPYYPYGKVHDEIGDVLESLELGDIAQILMSRDHLKSTIQRAWVLYNICEQTPLAKKGVMIITWAPELAEEHFDRIVEELSHNKKILHFYGYLIDDEKKEKRGKKRTFKTGKAFFRFQEPDAPVGLQCMSFKSGSITGQHPGIAMLDDIEDEDLSAAFYKKFRKVILKKLIPAVSKTGITIITGTIKGYDIHTDIYLMLKSNKEYLTFEYPAVIDTDTRQAAFPPMKDCTIIERQVPITSKATGKQRKNRFGELMFKTVRDVVEIANEDQYIITYPEKFTLKDLVKIRLKYRFGEIKKGREIATDDDFFSEYLLVPSQPSGKYFNTARISYKPPKIPNCKPFLTFEDVRDWCKQFNIPICMFVDPGGKDAHGVALSVGTALFGRYIMFDCKVMKRGLPAAARDIADLIEYWAVDEWAIEANFNQEELYGETIEDYLYNYLLSQGKERYYIMPRYCDNSTNKIKRIDARMSLMLGYDNDPIRFFLNPDADDIEQFHVEFKSFGEDITSDNDAKHKWDILDSMSSMHIHQLLYSLEAIGVSA